MKRPLLTLAAAAAIACVSTQGARAQIPQGLLQQLLPGNQPQSQNPNVEQAVREAYERGYRQGRQDQERSDLDRSNRSAPQNGTYGNQGNNRGPYGR